jgi:hypothetical protein
MLCGRDLRLPGRQLLAIDGPALADDPVDGHALHPNALFTGGERLEPRICLGSRRPGLRGDCGPRQEEDEDRDRQCIESS